MIFKALVLILLTTILGLIGIAAGNLDRTGALLLGTFLGVSVTAALYPWIMGEPKPPFRN